MATFPSPEAARQSTVGGTSNAAETVKVTGPDAKQGHKNSQAGTTWFKRTFDVPDATET